MIQRSFIYGTHYWRPPNPPREEHGFHLRKIKEELGFDLVKLRITWNWHHREPEVFSFDEVHELFDLCEEIGLSVLLELSLENAPYWLEVEQPQTRYVTASGRAVELGAQEATPGGGHPGLCFHHDVVVDAADRFIRAVVGQFKDREALFAYDCWNEPHLEPVWCDLPWGSLGDRLYCYCAASREAFRRWLKKRYGTIEELNARWGRAYGAFDQVNPPILMGTYADWLDWMRFWFHELQRQMAWRVKIIKEEDPKRLVASHSGAVPPVHPRANACIHNWKFAQPVDLWGTSLAPQAFNWDLATCAQVMELTRSAARGKPFWISEMPGGASNIKGFAASRHPRPQDYRAWNWLSVALGSQGTVHWCYLTERTGQEAGRFGMMRPNGDHTNRSRAIAETAGVLKAHQETIMSSRTTPGVAVFYDPDISSLLFAMDQDDELYGRSHAGYYHAVWQADLRARYVTPETLDDIDEAVLILPMALTLSEDTLEGIAAYVREGGTLVAEARTGMFDERGWLRPQLPALSLAEVAGLVEGEMIYSDPSNRPIVPTADGTTRETAPGSRGAGSDPISEGPPIAFTWPEALTIRAHGYLVPLHLQGAELLGSYDGIPLAATHPYGKGRVYYVGTYLGLALDEGDSGAERVMERILEECGPPAVRGGRLRPRLISGGSGALLTVFNDHRSERIEEEVVVPDGFSMAEDVYTGAILAVKEERLRVALDAESVGVFALRR